LEKICTDCLKMKNLSEFTKDKAKKDGTRGRCKKCLGLKLRKTPVPKIPKDGHKYCANCGEEKQLSEFNIRFSWKEYKPFSYCKSCEREKGNNRHKHKCPVCSKEYKSGSKEAGMCNDCRKIQLGKQGRCNMEKLNSDQQGENNRMYGVHRFGKLNPNYKPDKTNEEREAGRHILGYKDWVIYVYERDNYSCRYCGDNKGGNLNAHHLDGYSWCKDKRVDVNNGVTLCDKCHKEFHLIYNYNNNTRGQFEEFIKNEARSRLETIIFPLLIDSKLW